MCYKITFKNLFVYNKLYINNVFIYYKELFSFSENVSEKCKIYNFTYPE